MAKGNLLLGMGRGKLGDIVLYRQNGQQMSRPRTRVVKNPRTSGQQIQRMIQATIAYGYAGLKTIVDHSFEGVQYGQHSMSYFMKRNMDALRAKVLAESDGSTRTACYAIPNVRILYPNEYVVSNGSLAPCPNPKTFGNSGTAAFMRFGNARFNTLQNLMTYFNASAGDQLTFLVLNAKLGDVAQPVASLNGESVYAVALAVRRIKFKNSYTDAELATSPISNDALNPALFDMEVTSSGINVEGGETAVEDCDVFFTDLKDGIEAVAGCVIRSRKSGDSWLRSPQTIAFDAAILTPVFGFSLTTAYNAWMAGTTPVGVSEYILNGKPNTDIWPTVPDEGDEEPNP